MNENPETDREGNCYKAVGIGGLDGSVAVGEERFVRIGWAGV